MTTITIRLAGVPQGKGRPRFARATGRAYTPAKTVSYENELRLAAQDAMGDAALLLRPLAVDLIAVFPVPASWSKRRTQMALDGAIAPTGKPDADNLMKCLDALNQIVFRDDAQIIQCVVMKRYGLRPELRIGVEEYPGVECSGAAAKVAGLPAASLRKVG